MTIPRSIRFTATVSKDGTIQLPEGENLEGNKVEVILLPADDKGDKKITPTQFVEKWKGFLSDENVEDARYQYLKEKYS